MKTFLGILLLMCLAAGSISYSAQRTGGAVIGSDEKIISTASSNEVLYFSAGGGVYRFTNNGAIDTSFGHMGVLKNDMPNVPSTSIALFGQDELLIPRHHSIIRSEGRQDGSFISFAQFHSLNLGDF